MPASPDQIIQYLQDIPNSHRGPGGVAAVLRDGKVIGQQLWGYADLDRRIPMTSQTPLPICSISKQMVCLVLVDLVRNPTPKMASSGKDIWEHLSAGLRTMLPHLADHADGELTIAHLYNMQSGIRDYWAMTTLWGAKPDGPFSIAGDAPRALARTRSFHFPPGTEYSYSNVNFHILARLLEDVSGQSLGQLLAQRVFVPAGMSTASLCPNTAGHPLPCVGYEGDEKHGYVPAINRIEWSGDAGVVASLDDMVAYEAWLHRSWNDDESCYRAITEPQVYKNGDPAAYGFGLARTDIGGDIAIGHGGALRGFRLSRVHCPSQALSVVVMFNHEADAAGAADSLLKQALQWKEPPTALSTAAPDWQGDFLDDQTQLYVKVAADKECELSISYARASEKLKLSDATHAQCASMSAALEADVVIIDRLKEHRQLKARRIPTLGPTSDRQEYAGEYRCSDAESTFSCSGIGSLMYGSFDGFLGKGPIHIMRHVAGDVWLLTDPRGMDAQPPGDWTVVFRREDGKIIGALIGCWLARRLDFLKS